MSESSAESGGSHGHSHDSSPSLSKSLGGKLGPLPGYAWVGLAVVAYLVYRWWKNRNAPAVATSTAAAPSSSSVGSYPNGVDSSGYLNDFGPGSYTVTLPTGSTTPTPTPGGDTNNPSTPAAPDPIQFVVSDIADMEILLANGVPQSHIVYSGFDPNANKPGAGYGVPSGLPLPSSTRLVWVGLSGSQAPAGSTVIQGKTRTQTNQQIQSYLASNPLT